MGDLLGCLHVLSYLEIASLNTLLSYTMSENIAKTVSILFTVV